MVKKFNKAIGALIGGVTAEGLVFVFRAFDVDLDPAMAGALVVILAALGTYLAPKNQDASPVR